MFPVLPFVFLLFYNTVDSSWKVGSKSRLNFGRKNSRSLKESDEKLIDRQNILMWLTSPEMKRPVPLKLRQVNTDTDDDYYNEELNVVPTTTVTTTTKKKKSGKNKTQFERPIEVEGVKPIRLSLKIAGIIILSTILLTCCCTLILRNQLMSIVNKLTRKKQKSKLTPAEPKKGHGIFRKKKPLKRLQKEKKEPAYDVIDVTQDDMVPIITTAPATPHNSIPPISSTIQTVPTRDQAREPTPKPSPTGCYKCYKKRRRRKVKKTRK